MIKMILCCDINGGIGYKNDLLFNIDEDMKFFKETTINHKIIMGYNTWLSLPKKPLPKRENYVIYDGDEEIEGVKVLRSFEEIKALGEIDDIFIIGGAMVYNDLVYLGMIDEAYVTIVSAFTQADKFLDLEELNRKLPYREYIKDFKYGNVKVQLFKYTK